MRYRASAFLEAKMKEADVTYAELAKRLKKQGLKDETEAGINAGHSQPRSFWRALRRSNLKG
jgi:hypothetical protein